MYFILNETNQIIAADADLLKLCDLTHIDELNLNVALGKTTFDLGSEENLVITANGNTTEYPVSKISLSSMLGRITLIDIMKEEKRSADALSAFKEAQPEHVEEEIAVSDLDMELFTLEPEGDEIGLATADEEDNLFADLDFDKEQTAESLEEAAPGPSADTETIDFNDFDFLIKEEEAPETVPAVDDTDTIDLDLFIKEEEAPETEPVIDQGDEILINIEEVSRRMGVSEEDYDTFLKEYIDTALELENDLRSPEEQKRSDAVGTLSHLSDLLQLPMMSAMLARIHATEEEKQKETIESFYGALSKITTTNAVEKEPATEPLAMEAIEGTIKEEPEPAVQEKEKGFGSISLEGIKPIYFDFRLEEAAHDLSLPVDLIEEFVRDFIEQAHIETEKMLKAYEKGDLDAIQKIGHLLKGASSNLRINPLSDTLYKIQFCEDFSQLEAYIKDYWAHFLSFEIQINALTK